VSTIALAIYRFALLLYNARIPVLPRLINALCLRIVFGCYIGLGAKIGKGVCLAYGGLGTVIHHKVVIGNNVYIGSNVTIGGTNRKPTFPIIGDDCLISSGVRIIGSISVGKNCVIGANAVVIANIPDNCCAVGIPARVIKTGINVSDYR
jgi:serine O-acetyltransferase